jgi:hypothetical protein
MQQDNLGMSGHLDIAKIPGPHKARSIRIGKKRFFWTDDPGVSTRFADQYFQTHLTAVHRGGDGLVKGIRDFGSGTVTNVGVLSIANDFAWASPSAAAINTLKLANYHAVGTGTNASYIYNVALQTLAAPTTTTAVTGAQTLIAGTTGGDAASIQTYQTVATTNFTGAAAITEWGLFSSATLSSTTGTPFSGSSATSTTASVTGTPLTASSTTVAGEQGYIFQDNTAASPFWGMVTSNTTSVITVPAWYVVATGAVSGVNPVNGDAFTILPIMLDRQQFAAINVVNLDSIVWTFQLQVVSGG